eukprot:m51a1_g8889 putative serine threonine-protein kinase ctr1-like (1100) ;mRNA; r:673970-679300
MTTEEPLEVGRCGPSACVSVSVRADKASDKVMQSDVCTRFACLALLLCALGSTAEPRRPPRCFNVTNITIGQSVGRSQIEQGAAQGLRAAIYEANELTPLTLELVQLSHGSEEELVRNVHTLVEQRCVFMELLGNEERARTVKLPFVVNVRASGIDELNAVLSALSRDWEALSMTGMVTHDMPFDVGAQSYTNDSLAALTGRKFNEVFSQGELKALIVATTPNTTVEFVEMLARSGRTGLALYVVAWTSPEDLEVGLSSEAKSLLAASNILLYFTQNMPFPQSDNLDGAAAILRKFSVSTTRDKSHMALEGYLTGWFIYQVAQMAVARNGLPLTRWAFLNTVFVDVRTFNVMDVPLGPYGDGGMSGGTDTQGVDDECNQGVHEMFMTQYNPGNDTQTPIPQATLRFAGCTVPQWSDAGMVTVVGSFDDVAVSGEQVSARAGLLGAINDQNSLGDSSVLLRSRHGTIGDATTDLEASKVIAVAVSEISDPTYLRAFESVATIAPLPAYFTLTRPFQKMVINLFPTAYDEMMAAFLWFHDRGVNKFCAVRNDYTLFTEQCVQGLGNISSTASVRHSAAVLLFTLPLTLQLTGTYDAYLILGGLFDRRSVLDSMAVRLLNSQVVQSDKELDRNTTARARTHRISVYPPLSSFATTSKLRTDYSTWVSAESDARGLSFMGFIVGKFLSQAIDVAKGGQPNKNITAQDLVDAIYHRSVFTIGGLQFGPFRDTGSPRERCNQGSNTVFILQEDAEDREGSPLAAYTVGDCGRWYIPQDTESADGGKTPMILGLAIGLGGGTILCIVALRVVEFFNIRRGEIELGQCIGKGRYGSILMADWHGTTVAVRVIDKKATPREDQRLVKEEVLLLHKHHHPNLLMLMGFCETHTDILVVTEYMEGGTLADYLVKEKRFASVYSLVAMAFGIAYLHSCKPPIVHGSICSQNLLMDGKGTVKVSDFWFSNKRGAFSSSGSSRTLKRAAWQPPEVIAGTFLTPATDVYAFGIVLWELIAPIDMTQSLASSSDSQLSSAHATPSAPPSPRAIGIGAGSTMEIRQVQLGPPETPPNASPEVADLMERCWQTQPERRPSIFQILRNWPTTFAVRSQ